MSRLTYAPAAIVGLVAAALVVVGCNVRSEPGERQQAAPKPTAPPKPVSADDRPFQHWPTPQGALLITGEMIGYPEPCGCTKGQRGGLARRRVLVEMLKQEGWPLVLIDLGHLLNDRNTHGGPEQTKVKLGVILKALAMLDYDAVALGVDDLRLGVLEFVSRLLGLPERPAFVAANVAADPGLDLGGHLRPSLRASAGPVRLGITAVSDPAAFEALNDPDKALLTFTRPEDALPTVLADLETDTDVQVLMVQGPPEAARRLAKAFPGFDIVVGTSQYVDPPKDPEILNDGKTWLITVGKKGQYLGVVGFFDDEKTPRRYQRVMLGERYDSYKELAAPIRTLLDVDYPADLKAAGVLESYPRTAYQRRDFPAGARYVGADACKHCHPRTYNKWLTTKHAHAYEPLTNPGRNRESDADCVRCHTTGFEFEGGFVNAEQTPLLKNNGCENCHGPGSLHVAAPDDKEVIRAMTLDSVTANRDGLCLNCHDEDNSPEFDFATWYPKIQHKDLDTYTNPRVHKGLDPATLRGAGGD